MTLYAKFISNTQVEFPPKNKGNIINYNLNVEELLKDGYKEFIPATKEIGKAYNIVYIEVTSTIREIATEITPDPEVLLQQAKEAKIQENDIIRDEALNQGVEYKNVLFDSDTDQKVNLIAMVESMNASQKIIWFGKDNQPLECTKQDLINIGGLITQLHSFCWSKNYEIKQAINACQTIEELENIIIDYKEN